MSEEVRKYQMYIGGEFVQAASGESSQSVCPADQKVLARFPKGGPEDVQKAVASATSLGRPS